jgi:hypothetical protein
LASLRVLGGRSEEQEIIGAFFLTALRLLSKNNECPKELLFSVGKDKFFAPLDIQKLKKAIYHRGHRGNLR